MIHKVILWPFKKIDAWLRSYYQSKQLKEQIALQQRHLLLETTPILDVQFRMNRSPDPPRRSDIPAVDVVVQNYGGTTYIREGRIWITLSHRPTDKQIQHIADTQMPKGKKQEFFFIVIHQFFDKVVDGTSILKGHYELHLDCPNGNPQEQKGSYTYEPRKNVFVLDK
jgi:hypothetical protein